MVVQIPVFYFKGRSLAVCAVLPFGRNAGVRAVDYPVAVIANLHGGRCAVVAVLAVGDGKAMTGFRSVLADSDVGNLLSAFHSRYRGDEAFAFHQIAVGFELAVQFGYFFFDAFRPLPRGEDEGAAVIERKGDAVAVVVGFYL